MFSAEFLLAEKQSFEIKFRKLFGKEKNNGKWLEKDCEKELFGRISYMFFECVPKSCFYRLFMSGQRNRHKLVSLLKKWNGSLFKSSHLHKTRDT